MNWWEDPFSRKIRFREFKRLWYWTVFDIFLFVPIIYSVCYQISIKNQMFSTMGILISGVVLPITITILLSSIALHYKVWNANSEWSEREVVVYRDIIETFTKILVSFHRDFGNPFEPAMLRRFYDLEMLSHSIETLKVFVNTKGNFNFENYRMMNISALIEKLTVQYTSILSNNCTNSAVKLYYMILMTHLIKLDEAMNQLATPQLSNEAHDDVYNQLNNYMESLPFLYKIVYPIVEKGMGIDNMKHNLNYYYDEIFADFTTDGTQERKEMQDRALKRAWEIRNYEINLYWHRAAYFWVFNATIAVACYNIKSENTLIIAVLLLLGFACSFAWVLSNIASKHWQENWENHIRLLEKNIEGRLYATTINHYESPLKPSVSRLNLKISVLINSAWLIISVIFGLNLRTDNMIYSIIFFIAVSVIVIFMLANEVGKIKKLLNLRQLLFDRKDYNTLYTSTLKVEDIDIYDAK